MTSTGRVHDHRGSKLLADDAIAADTIAMRREIERQDDAFIAACAAAIKSGNETARGCVGLKVRA
jgi:hypothetical protein